MTGTAGQRKNEPSDWKPVWLEAFGEYGTVYHACKAAGVGRSTVYRHRESDAEFAEAWAAVEEDVSDDLEQEAARRAKDGSDVLMIFLLKARRPQKYRDNAHITHTGSLSLERVLFDDVDKALTAG